MTIVKWQNPSRNAVVNRNTNFKSPFSDILDFWGDDFFTKERAAYVPAVNVWEENGKYNLELSAPGFQKEDFKIELHNGVLTVSGEYKTEKENTGKNFSRKEFNYGSFQRTFSLPESINEEAVEAKYENGILTISLANLEEPKKAIREIKIA